MTQPPAQDTVTDGDARTDSETDSETDSGSDSGTDPGAIVVDNPSVSCDGGGGALGHPRVYLRIGASGAIVCPYCSRRFVLAEGAASVTGH